jgi:hypothetical protein
MATCSVRALVLQNKEDDLMKRFSLTLTAVALVMGSMAIAANAQTQAPGAGSLQALKNATPYVRQAACNGFTGGCGCAAGWVSACANRCCKCVRCY